MKVNKQAIINLLAKKKAEQDAMWKKHLSDDSRATEDNLLKKCDNLTYPTYTKHCEDGNFKSFQVASLVEALSMLICRRVARSEIVIEEDNND